MPGRRTGLLLALEDDRWCLVRVRGDAAEVRDLAYDPQAGPASAAGAVAEALREWGYRGGGVCLGLPAEMVYSAQIPGDGLPRRQRHLAMLYRLEEQLPLDAEGLTADFLPAGAGHWTGVAVETAGVEAVLEALAEAGVEVARIAATSLLAAWQACRNGGCRADYCLLARPRRVEALRLLDGRPTAWYSAPAEPPEALADALNADQLLGPTDRDRPTASAMGQLDPAVAAQLQDRAGLALGPSDDAAPVVSAARAAAADERAGWVNLRRGALAMRSPWSRHRGLVALAAVLGAALLAALAVMFHWRARQYDLAAEGQFRRQAGLYRQLYPNTRVPANVAGRLRSELARLRGVSGSGDRSAPEPANALEGLRRICASFPPDMRLRITEVRVSPQTVLVEGQVRNHSDAEAIAQAMRSRDFLVDPPRTEHLVKGGVAFTIAGKPGAEPPAETKGGPP